MISKESPLQGTNIGTIATVSIHELPGLHTIDLRVTRGTSTQVAIAGALGIDLTGKPGQIAMKSLPGDGEGYALCLAPDWWLVVGLQDAGQILELWRLNNDHHFSAVDVTGQRTTIVVEGAKVREVLAHLWEQDLRDKSFPVGSVSQGLIAKAPVIVCHIAPFRYRVMVRSSFALHLWKALVDAAEEWM